MFPDIHFTAIDLSLASLAYAKKKAGEYGADNLEFMHCDILDLDQIEKTFDIIECSGVLHHMQNPEEGWKHLIRRLSPGGRMNIGLYSLAARESVQAARKYAAEKGYPATTEGIRAFRQDILPSPTPIRQKPYRRGGIFTPCPNAATSCFMCRRRITPFRNCRKPSKNWDCPSSDSAQTPPK